MTALPGYLINSLTHRYMTKIIDLLEPHDMPHDNYKKYDVAIPYILQHVSQLIDDLYENVYSAQTKQVHVKLTNINGEVLMDLGDIEAPAQWDELAIRIFASKYLMRGRENSILKAFKRIILWLTTNGILDHHLSSNITFPDTNEKITDDIRNAFMTGVITDEEFVNQLYHGLFFQRLTFNSPVWFNMGTNGDYGPVVCSACNITEVEDDMGSIIANSVIKQMIALNGAGSGIDLTPIRSSQEDIGGDTTAHPTGPIGFMRMFDAVLAATKSGGKHRRSAGLTALSVHHPDILDYIEFKSLEEEKGRWLANMPGFDVSFGSTGPMTIYGSLAIQNINPAVRLDADFWDKYIRNSDIELRNRHGDAVGYINARELLRKIAEAQLKCGDPGLLFEDNMNKWNPLIDGGEEFEIKTTNPCGEMTWKNNSACNLASLRITAYFNVSEPQDSDSIIVMFNSELFDKDIETLIIAQDIIVDNAIYPTKAIAETSWKSRNLGLNYGDLGELLFQFGIPYNHERAYDLVAAITSLVTSKAYITSMKMAKVLGPYEWIDRTVGSMMHVLEMHRDAIQKVADKYMNISSIGENGQYDVLAQHIADWTWQAAATWNIILDGFYRKNYPRNSAVTLFAPMGTTGLVLGCKTTGLEPKLSFNYSKAMVSGDNAEFVLEGPSQISKKLYRVLNNNCSVDVDCAQCEHFGNCDLLKTSLGTRSDNGDVMNVLSGEEHVRMMAAVQPHISMGSSKTCNLPADSTVDDLVNIYVLAHKLGLKGITVYVDGSKVYQPMQVSDKDNNEDKKDSKEADSPFAISIPIKPDRINTDPNEIWMKRYAVTIGNEKLYIFVGWHPQAMDKIWEVWLRASGIGGSTDGYLATIAMFISNSLQDGIVNGNYEEAKENVIKVLMKTEFAPNGFVSWGMADPPQEFKDVKFAKSVSQLVGQLLKRLDGFPVALNNYEINVDNKSVLVEEQPIEVPYLSSDLKICPQCGAIMQKSGSGSHCYVCPHCGDSVGGCGA